MIKDAQSVPQTGKKKEEEEEEEEEEEDSFGFLLPIRRSSSCYALRVGVESRVQGWHNNNNAKGERSTTTSAREETKKKRRREKRLEKMRIRIPGGRKVRGHKSVQVGVKYEA